MTTVALGSLFQFIRNGMNVKQDKSQNGLPITRIETISDAVVDPTRVGYAGVTEETAGDRFLEPGDILFSHINSVQHIGKCAVYRGEPSKLIHGMNLLCLRSDREKLLPEFAKYLLRSGQFRARLSNSIKRAVNQASVSIGDLKTIPVLLPSLPEQRRIAEILDKADALRAKRRAALAQLDTLTQSIFLDMFGDPATNPKRWPTSQLQCVVKTGTIVTYGIVQAGDEFPNGVPYIRTGDIVNGEIVCDGTRHTDPTLAAKFARSRVQAGEIVMSIRATVGTTALVPIELDGANLTQGTARIAPGDRVEAQYLLHLLRAPATQHWISLQIKGATFREITLTRLRELPVLVPPLDLQQEFAGRVEIVLQLKASLCSSQSELDALFASLRDRAFGGKQ